MINNLCSMPTVRPTINLRIDMPAHGIVADERGHVRAHSLCTKRLRIRDERVPGAID
jgi:hypothetical protein